MKLAKKINKRLNDFTVPVTPSGWLVQSLLMHNIFQSVVASTGVYNLFSKTLRPVL